MTDARLPERWLLDRRLNRASDAAHRTFINVLLYAVANRTDGVVELSELELITRVRPECVPELVRLELVRVDGDQLTLVDFAATQTSRDELEVLENARRRDREKKARQRAEAAEKAAVPGTVPGDVPGDRPRGRPGGRVPGTAQEGRKAGRQAVTEDPVTDARERDDDSPPVRPALIVPDDDELVARQQAVEAARRRQQEREWARRQAAG
ncbi:hypothetical protein [Geodermatophilus sp. URMC 62]|uniref:hypothetical protein n=1 Tax=Geodermatophilus sp. URMC 62 TaxID=3423414 RepID=UPI00406C2D30